MNRLSRRDMLRHVSRAGLGIAPLLLGIQQRLRAETASSPRALPLRFLFVVKSSGLTPADLAPRTEAGRIKAAEDDGWPRELDPTDHRVDTSFTEESYPKALAPLAAHRDYLTVLQGLSGKMCRGGHSAWYGALGCYHTGDEGSPGRAQSATIDGELVKRSPASVFPHVGLSLGGKVLSGVKDSVVYPGISAVATDRPLPFQASPDLAYKNLFGVAAVGKEAAENRKIKAMLLDHVVEDVKRLQRQTAGVDKDKLDHYLEAFEGLRDRRRHLQGMEATIRAHAPTVDDKFVSQVETDRLEAHFDLAAAALISGLTNVVTVRADTLDVTYRGLGISRHVHGLGHAESVDGMTPVEARNRIREFHLQQIARVATKLRAIPEADGNLLDRTLIVYLSDAAEQHHASCRQWPFVLVGGLGGQIERHGSGRYVEFPGYESAGHRTTASFYNRLLAAAGHPQDQFGRLDLNLPVEQQQGPLEI